MRTRPFFLVLVLLVVSCSSVNQQRAEQNAVDFVRARVVFYSRLNDSSQNVNEYTTQVTSSNKIGYKWYIKIQISTTINNTLKQKDLAVVVDSRNGRVIEFNNVPVPQ